MRRKIAASIATIIISTILPFLLNSLIPIEASYGWPLVGIFILFGATVLVWGYSTHSATSWETKVLPISLMCIGFFAFAGGAIWYYRAHSGTVAELAQKILLRCEPSTLPDVVPPKGLYWINAYSQIFEGARRTGATFGHSDQQPGTRYEWNVPMPRPALKCIITNYSSKPLLNVSLDVLVDFKTADITHEDGAVITRHGDSLGSYLARSQPFQLDPGENNSITFYAVNDSPFFLELILPKSLDAQLLDSEKRFRVTIRTSQNNGSTLNPDPNHKDVAGPVLWEFKPEKPIGLKPGDSISIKPER